MHHLVAVQPFFGPGRHAARIQKAQPEQPDHDAGARGPFAGPADFGAEQPGGPQRHAGVHDAEQEAGAQQAQLGRQQQREHQRYRQRAQVVEGQHAADDFAEFRLALVEHAHHQRNLHADHQADDEDAHVQGGAKGRGQPCEHQEEDRRRHPAQQGDQQLHVDEPVQDVFVFYIF
ncbi:hypothetical protein D3C78_1418300 [compost metagenome]